MDRFSKFHVLFPLKRKTAEEVSYMLQERVLAYLGPPKIFHSYNGREFVNNLIRASFEKWGGDVTFVSGRPRHSVTGSSRKRKSHCRAEDSSHETR